MTEKLKKEYCLGTTLMMALDSIKGCEFGNSERTFQVHDLEVDRICKQKTVDEAVMIEDGPVFDHDDILTQVERM